MDSLPHYLISIARILHTRSNHVLVMTALIRLL